MSHFKKLAIVAALSVAFGTAALASEVKWSYEGDTGPEHWASLHENFASCAGDQQSPIDIQPSSVVDAELLPLEINWNESVDLSVANTGHGIQDNGADLGSATINGKQYTLKQFHFHHPSEHTINGKHFPAEAHFVHQASDGSLAVIAVLLEGGGENMVFNDSLSSATGTIGEAHLGKESPRDLLPEDLSFYTYRGSLTTPPCSEIVDWAIIKTPMKVSDKNIEAFAKLYSNDARPTQDLGRRYVLQ
ncbi:carbonic anhydrase [Halomonas binhaiensis]|uniref:Carbonic anhydrase n=1 Tax=Halomonas binhaiensis TaxID=2562282 RepID=A0A856QQ02_9GAMM|nr:carbonic anhydrase family protein [Halomonas binhaiensis]QEM81956.2 carbonic anhydrase family protein [Halomonas binhaiensis]